MPGKAAMGWTGIGTQVSVAPNIDDLISIMDGAHLWSSFQWTFLKTFGEPSKISFHFISLPQSQEIDIDVSVLPMRN